jgi:hypothetical protein
LSGKREGPRGNLKATNEVQADILGIEDGERKQPKAVSGERNKIGKAVTETWETGKT